MVTSLTRSLLTIGLIAGLALSGCASQKPVAATGGGQPNRTAPASDQRQGDANHPKILKAFGGEYQNASVRSYVREVGMRLAAQSEMPTQKWTFTVLDSPVVNAFAAPGGYVYVTRGLVALASDEAELAGVIGHEIGHVTARHSAQRQADAALAQGVGLLATLGAAILGGGDIARSVGQTAQIAGAAYVANYSRAQEREADVLGIRYLGAAGYDPQAGADFLENLQAQSELHAQMTRRDYDPNRVDMFASHPATAERVGLAKAEAAKAAQDGERGRARHLKLLQGITYGDAAAQGFVRGRRFSHPDLRFTFQVPKGYRLINTQRAVAALGPNKRQLVLDGGEQVTGRLDAFIANKWAPAIAQKSRVGDLAELRRVTINGLPAASAYLPVATSTGPKVALLTAIRHGDKVYRFTGLFEKNANRSVVKSINDAVRTFRVLSDAEARRLKPQRIDIVTVKRGQTVSGLARQMPAGPLRQARFRVLNGLSRGEGLKAGQKVKVVRGG